MSGVPANHRAPDVSHAHGPRRGAAWRRRCVITFARRWSWPLHPVDSSPTGDGATLPAPAKFGRSPSETCRMPVC